MLSTLKTCPLFANMTDEDINDCLLCSGSEVINYNKDESIFYQQDEPKYLYILLDGVVDVCSDTVAGKRVIITSINQKGEIFGEVFLFLNHKNYDNYAIAVVPSKVLLIPRSYFYHRCAKNCIYHNLLISNMLSILSQKAFYLNRKLQIMSSSSLRQKISRVLLQHVKEDGMVELGMNREELADFLGVARPSLSRELMDMQKDGLIKTNRKVIQILDQDELQQYL